MTRTAFQKELVEWLSDSEERFQLMVNEAPVGKSTLRMTMSGHYSPGARLEKAMRGVMVAHPLRAKQKAAAV